MRLDAYLKGKLETQTDPIGQCSVNDHGLCPLSPPGGGNSSSSGDGRESDTDHECGPGTISSGNQCIAVIYHTQDNLNASQTKLNPAIYVATYIAVTLLVLVGVILLSKSIYALIKAYKDFYASVGKEENSPEPEQKTELPVTAYQLAELHQVGQPLACYDMRPQWIRIWQAYRDMLLRVVICVLLFALAAILIFLSEVFQGQIQDPQLRLSVGLVGIIPCFFSGVEWLIMKHMVAREIPASLLVCTKGLIVIYPKVVDVLHWDEVKGPLIVEERKKKRKSYKLRRIKGEPLVFNDAYEDSESLIELVRQQIQRG
ncbi:hypothetical protein [Tengunoibacter tsumagoiensis]|nr:hypothetical protein [Tengunoibacter tsumagoiensis]